MVCQCGLLQVLLLSAVGQWGAASVSAASAPAPVAHWPDAFFANFSEHLNSSFLFPNSSHGANFTAYYALDLSYKGKDGHVGASAVYRSDGKTALKICHAFHPNTACIQMKVSGHLYLVYPEINECCRCCSWEHGCGPLKRNWTAPAVYMGRRNISGLQCDKFSVAGEIEAENYLAQTTDGKHLCELDNGGIDQMYFDQTSWLDSVDPGLFDLPAGCDAHCGFKNLCLFG